MNDAIVYIGPTPASEDCAQIGEPDYARNAKIECRAFIEAIRKVCGPEPEGARLTIKSQSNDFGQYYEVAVVFDGTNEDAIEYADKVDRHAPATWEQAGMVAPIAKVKGRGY